ncbi:hypothetical protein [Streptomyces sp. SPB162]|uniref:hypothetical protein n=1 Tax=Streptomyces sp. SPB162 TaxID=2940560 RepID=UPI0024072C4A|nr:hypothetical protein [Streptomyces sp. SPB162]MDF9815488.1 putative component of toxin-antitoxin plasmid stabilization module [Streptomyces sp. SPB162]
MTTPRGSAQAALLARIMASGLPDEPAAERAAAEAEAAAEGLADCVERVASGGVGDAEPASVGGVGEVEPALAGGAESFEGVGEGLGDCVERVASGGVGGVEPASVGGVGDVEPASAGGAESFDVVAEGLGDCVERVASGGVGGVEPASAGGIGDAEPASAGGAESAEVVAEGLADCVERVASGGVGDAEPASAGGAESAEVVAEGLGDCVERVAAGGVGDVEPLVAETVVPRPTLRSVGDVEPLDGGAPAAPAAAGGMPGSAAAESDTRLAAQATRRRGPADPVRSMMHRHEELCAGAVDVLEIAAGLEAQGVTDRVAGRFRHRDVFSLAEELYARVPHGAAGERTGSGRVGPVRVGVLHVVPGAGCAAAAAFAVRSPAVGAVVALLVALTTWAALRRGPLRTESAGGALWGGWLLAFALCGGPLLTGLLGAPLDPPATAPFVALALTLAPAAWCAHRFALRARAELASSRGLGEFAARARPLLVGTLALYLVVLLALLWAAAALAGPAGVAGAGALGILLFMARLLAVHGFTRAAAWGTGVAAAAEAAALGAAALHHVPGLAALSTPVELVGPAAIPVLACGCAATVLVTHAFRTLTRASAHGTGARTASPTRPRPADLRNPNQEQR